MRILIAEDDTRLLKSLVHIFELSHYAVDGVGKWQIFGAHGFKKDYSVSS